MNSQAKRFTQRVTFLVFALNVCLFTSCESKVPFGEVEGVVKINGQPAEWVEVVFMPDPMEGTKGKRASCYTDAQGRYRLRTSGEHGAIVGKHRVVFLDAANVAGPLGPEEDDPGALSRPQPPVAAPPAATLVKRPRIADEYTLPDRTPYKNVEVREGTQTLDFDLRGIK